MVPLPFHLEATTDTGNIRSKSNVTQNHQPQDNRSPFCKCTQPTKCHHPRLQAVHAAWLKRMVAAFKYSLQHMTSLLTNASVFQILKTLAGVDERTTYHMAGNIGGNFTWWFCEKGSKINAGSFSFGGYRLKVMIIHKIMAHPPIQTTCVYLWAMEKYMYVRGHHASRHFWTLTIGETLICKRKSGNATDLYAVAVIANSTAVSHIPRKISTACSLFLH